MKAWDLSNPYEGPTLCLDCDHDYGQHWTDDSGCSHRRCDCLGFTLDQGEVDRGNEER